MPGAWLKTLGSGLLLSVCLVSAVIPCHAGPPLGDGAATKEKAVKTPPAKDEDKAAREALELAAKIDKLLAARWDAGKVQPAAPADDAQFLRRVYLDVVGRIPSVAEARAFLADRRSDKRLRLVDRLLKSPAYVTHSANVWVGLLVPDTDANFQFTRPGMEMWLRQQFSTNVGYDKLVREVLTYSMADQNNPGPSPSAFYDTREYKAETLGAATSRLFLGVSIECAQCHDHPFAVWKREQFWEFAAFFAGFGSPENGRREVKDRREIAISAGNKMVQANFLDGTEPKWRYDVSSRQVLAEWVTSPQNPYFSRAGANRLWASFFGTGLVEPIDDLRPENPASNPELLDELATQFAAHQFDLKFMIRAITATRAYQLSSVVSHPSQDDARLFARMPVKGLSPEQLFDSLALATGFRETKQGRFFFQGETIRDEFLSQFASQDKRTEVQTSILQSLMLMNGKLMEEATNPDRGGTLAAVTHAPFLDATQKLETLYLAALARPPRPDEVERFSAHLKAASAKGKEKSAFGDVFWVLLNSPEFMLNH